MAGKQPCDKSALNQDFHSKETPVFFGTSSQCTFCRKVVNEDCLMSMFRAIKCSSKATLTFEYALGSHVFSFVPISAKYCLPCLWACEKVNAIRKNIEYLRKHCNPMGLEKNESCKRKSKSQVPSLETSIKRICMGEVKKGPSCQMLIPVFREKVCDSKQKDKLQCDSHTSRKEQVVSSAVTHFPTYRDNQAYIKKKPCMIKVKNEPEYQTHAKVTLENAEHVSHCVVQEEHHSNLQSLTKSHESSALTHIPSYSDNQVPLDKNIQKSLCMIEIKKEPEYQTQEQIALENAEKNCHNEEKDELENDLQTSTKEQSVSSALKHIPSYSDNVHDDSQKRSHICDEIIERALQRQSKVSGENDYRNKEKGEHQFNVQNPKKEQLSFALKHILSHSDYQHDFRYFISKLMHCSDLDDIVKVSLGTKEVRKVIEHNLLIEIKSACERMCSKSYPHGPSVLRKDLGETGEIETDIFYRIVLEIADKNPFLFKVLKTLCTTVLSKPSSSYTIAMMFAMGMHARNSQLSYLQQLNSCVVSQDGNTNLLSMLSKIHVTLDVGPTMNLLGRLKKLTSNIFEHGVSDGQTDLQTSIKELVSSVTPAVNFCSVNPNSFINFFFKSVSCLNFDDFVKLALDTKEVRQCIENKLVLDINSACDMMSSKTYPHGPSVLRTDLGTSSKIKTDVFDKVILEMTDKNPFLLEVLRTVCTFPGASKRSVSYTVAMMFAMGMQIRCPQMSYLQQLNSCIVALNGNTYPLNIFSKVHLTLTQKCKYRLLRRMKELKSDLFAPGIDDDKQGQYTVYDEDTDKEKTADDFEIRTHTSEAVKGVSVATKPCVNLPLRCQSGPVPMTGFEVSQHEVLPNGHGILSTNSKLEEKTSDEEKPSSKPVYERRRKRSDFDRENLTRDLEGIMNQYKGMLESVVSMRSKTRARSKTSERVHEEEISCEAVKVIVDQYEEFFDSFSDHTKRVKSKKSS